MAGKADRLRDFVRERKEAPLTPVPTPQQWQTLLEQADFTPDDLRLLANQVRGHKERARRAAEAKDGDSLAFEALQALLLDPFDADFITEIRKILEAQPWQAEDLASLKTRLGGLRKTRKPLRLPWWGTAVFGGVLVAILAVTLLVWHPWDSGAGLPPPTPVAQTRDLAFTMDTQGVPLKLTVQKSRLTTFAEASVVEIQAYVEFPSSRIAAWSGNLVVLDKDGAPISTQALSLRTSRDPSLEAGQSLELFQQLDAAAWGDRAQTVAFQTTEIQAIPSDPASLVTLTVSGKETLSGGHDFQLYLLSSTWKDRFASRVNQLSLELRNTGLKPFRSLVLQLQWLSSDGQILKTLDLKPVSAFRVELPSGGHVSLDPETVFETEIFHWPAESPPHPILRLESWQ